MSGYITRARTKITAKTDEFKIIAVKEHPNIEGYHLHYLVDTRSAGFVKNTSDYLDFIKHTQVRATPRRAYEYIIKDGGIIF